MGRKIEEYKRKSRERHKVILIGAEGTNVTESNYFKHFSKRNMRVIMANGNSTVPVKMVNDIIKTMKNKDINPEYEEVSVYCVFDTDTDEKKNKQIKEAIALAKKYGIEIITSNPCFEDWFLCHYEKTTRSMNNKDVVDRLEKHLGKYEKNMDIYPMISELQDKAIHNAKIQCNYQIEQGRNINSTMANPSTEVYKIIENINDFK